MNSEINSVELLCDFNIIYTICKDIADNKTTNQVNILLVEELSELIKPIMKFERYNTNDKSLRNNNGEIIENLYEELGDVVIMILQFIYKNRINYNDLIEKISAKLVRYYETISDKK